MLRLLSLFCRTVFHSFYSLFCKALMLCKYCSCKYVCKQSLNVKLQSMVFKLVIYGHIVITFFKQCSTIPRVLHLFYALWNLKEGTVKWVTRLNICWYLCLFNQAYSLHYLSTYGLTQTKLVMSQIHPEVCFLGFNTRICFPEYYPYLIRPWWSNYCKPYSITYFEWVVAEGIMRWTWNSKWAISGVWDLQSALIILIR